MTDIACKLLVIGAGPGGYACAIRAGRLGVDTVIVEEAQLGGTCLNVGCIPSKALIHAATEFHKLSGYKGGSPLGISADDPSIDFARTSDWIQGIVGRLNQGVGGLLKKAKVRTIHGVARFRDGKTVVVATSEGEQRIKAQHIVIATGSEPIPLPDLPFGADVMSSTEALALRTLPRRLAVVGGGYIGLEIGTAFAKLGTEVTVVEAAPRILPQYDASLSKPVETHLARLQIKVLTSSKATAFADGHLSVAGENAPASRIAADKVLLAVGRRPRTRGFGLEGLRLTMNGAFLQIDQRCQTSMRGVYAIGDVTGEPMLAHRAMAQAEVVANVVAGKNTVWDKVAIPAICFTDPEIVTVGQSPDDAKAAGLDAVVEQFPFHANGRAMTTEREDGFVRVVARRDNGLLLGIQAVGDGVSELAAGFALALEMGARTEDVAATIHAHPTRGEAFQEACLKALGMALHI